MALADDSDAHAVQEAGARKGMWRKSIDLSDLAVVPQPEHDQFLVSGVFPLRNKLVSSPLIGFHKALRAGVINDGGDVIVGKLAGISQIN